LPPWHYTRQLRTQDPRGHQPGFIQLDGPDFDDSGLTDLIQDEVKSGDNKYNGECCKEQNVPLPDLGKEGNLPGC
jgi:hypothetical protein